MQSILKQSLETALSLTGNFDLGLYRFYQFEMRYIHRTLTFLTIYFKGQTTKILMYYK